MAANETRIDAIVIHHAAGNGSVEGHTQTTPCERLVGHWLSLLHAR